MPTKKEISRIRRASKSRYKIRDLRKLRLCVHRTARHIYAQIIDASGGQVLTATSSLDKRLRSPKNKAINGGNIETAKAVGALIAEQAKNIDIEAVAFDRSGYKYHGRVKALAEAAREGGLKF